MSFDQILDGNADVLLSDVPSDRIDSERMDSLRARYVAATALSRTHALFVERAFQLVRPGGYVALVAPTSFVLRESCAPLRHALSEFDITHLIDASAAFLHGHWLPSLVLAGRARAPRAPMAIATSDCVEPQVPPDGDPGIVWRDLLSQIGHSCAVRPARPAYGIGGVRRSLYPSAVVAAFFARGLISSNIPSVGVEQIRDLTGIDPIGGGELVTKAIVAGRRLEQWAAHDTQWIGELCEFSLQDGSLSPMRGQPPWFAVQLLAELALHPALGEGAELVRVLDHACASGHLLCDAFRALVAHYSRRLPAREAADCALASVTGVDSRPEFVAAARLRLVLAWFDATADAAGVRSAAERTRVVLGDALLDGVVRPLPAPSGPDTFSARIRETQRGTP